MNPEEKSSMNAEPNILSAEAALRLFPVKNQIKDASEPTHKDGDDGSSTVLQYLIEVGLNGFFVTITYAEDTEDMRYIAETMDDVVLILRGHL